ncbi:MAG: hypothetical protein ACRC5M_03585 [Anaeroplasmataceae bacterium]
MKITTISTSRITQLWKEDGLSPLTIADIFGVTEDTIKAILKI